MKALLLTLTLILPSTFVFSQTEDRNDLQIENNFIDNLNQERLEPTTDAYMDTADEPLADSLDEALADNPIDTHSTDTENISEFSEEEFSTTEEAPTETINTDLEFDSNAEETQNPNDDFGHNITLRPEDLKNTTGKEIKIKHPLSNKGLTRITRQAEYIYEVKKSPQENASTVLFSNFSPTNFAGNATDDSSNVKYFDEIYNSSIMVTGDYEWQKWKTSIGKFGYKLGSGLVVSSGYGVYKSDSTTKSPESLTLFLLPNTASGVWRMQFYDAQMFIPYVEAGLGLYTFAEYRPDDSDIRFGLATLAYGAGGIAINISKFSQDNARILDREYGINAVTLNVEYRIAQGFGTFDLSHTNISGGFGFEF